MKFILAILLSGSTAFAQLVGNDSDYRVREAEAYRFIYSTEYEQLTNKLAPQNSVLNGIYEKEFAWRLDELATIGLASSQNQITNGFATQFPRLWTLFYNGGPGAIDEFGMVSWSDTLLIHEVAHLYQLNPRQDLSSIYKKIFGNADPQFLFPFTYIISPNVFLPTFMTEGNATFNESRFENGGRLYSGYYRAMFLQLLKSGKLTDSRIINDHIDWPFNTEKYIVGGYFNSYLAETYSPEQVNNFFYVNSARYIWPFLLDDSFKSNYQKGFYELYSEFKNHYKSLADEQTQLNVPVLTTSHGHNAFTVNGDVVAFMTSSSQGLNKLCLFHKNKKELKCEKSLLPFGRVFRHNKQWVSSAYQQTHPTEIRAGLFYDGYQRIDAFNDQYIYSKKGPHIVYADAKNSFDKTRVFKNGQFVDEMQSSPYMDTKGNLYYFKQQADRRYLYKNGRQVFSIYGYYGRVVDVSSQGKIYFTGSTRGGASLFSWDGSAYAQEVSSDLVIDAKLLTGRDVLVAELTHNGIETKITSLAVQDGAPVLYKYGYADSKIQKLLSQPQTDTEQALDYEYSPLLEMKYNGVTPTYGYVNPDGSVWSLNFEFSDPLQRYRSNFILSDGGFQTYGAQWVLQSQLNRLNWAFSAAYDEQAITTVVNGLTKFSASIGELDLNLFFNYPIIQTPLWNSDFGFGYAYESRFAAREELQSFTGTGRYTNSGILTYDLNYSFQNRLDYSAARFAGLELGYKHESDGGDWDNATPVYAAKTKLQWDVLWQSFISASYEAAMTDGPSAAIRLDNDDPPLTFDPTDIFRLGSESINRNYHELRKVNAEYKQAIPVKQYFSRIPIGLHRVAPFYGYSEFYGSTVKNAAADTLFHESYYGAEFEILLFHKITSRLKAIEIESSLGLTRQEYTLSVQSDF